jgi:hypothetical protein
VNRDFKSLFVVVVASALACTVGKDGKQGDPGVPCSGCVNSASLAPGAVSSAALGDGVVKTPNIGAKAVTGAQIADGAVDAVQLADAAVTSAKVADGSILANHLGAGVISGSNIAAGTIAGSNITPSTTITAGAYRLNTPLVRQIFADPVMCQRTFGPAYQDVATDHPPSNFFGPSVEITNTAAGSYEFYCAVPLARDSGASITIVAASMGFFDASTNCLVSADLRSKVFGASSTGTVMSTVFDGADGTDFAFTASGPQVKLFPAFAPVVVPANSLLFLRAQISIQALGASGCRYSGATIAYTTDRP